MKNSYILMLFGALLLASCAKETAREPLAPAKVYTFSTTVSDPLTRSFFKDTDEAPSRWIYWDADDEFDFHDITLTEEGENVTVTSGKPTEIAVDQKTALFTQAAHDYMVITYPKGSVTVNGSQATVTVPREQALTSVLSPENVPMASLKLALSETALQKVGTEGEVAVAFSNPVQIYPLAALVKMTVKGLPGVTSAKITKVNILSEFDNQKAGSPQVGLRGPNVFSLAEGMEFVSTWASGDNYTRNDLVLSGGTPVEYTAEKGADICFVSDHSASGMKTLQIAVYTEDGGIYKKKFSTTDSETSQGAICFNKSKVSCFSVDFSDGTVTKGPDTHFCVEWSEGYLVFDEANAGYKIGQPEDIGLYFKFGSATGFKFFKDNDDWALRLQPKDAEGNKLSGSTTYMDNKTTLANGTEMFYSGILQGGVRFYGENALWQDTPYYYPEDGKIVAGTLTGGNDGDEFHYHAINGTTSFSGAADPCSYVKVASGEKAWRLPTKEEIEDLITVGAPGIEYFTADGSEVRGTSGNGSPVSIRYSDGDQSLAFKCAGNVTQTFSSQYTQIQMTFSNKYAVRFWSNAYEGQQEPQKSTTNSGYAYNLSLSSAPGFNTAASTAKYPANRINNYTTKNGTQYILWDAIPVRCVRDK